MSETGSTKPAPAAARRVAKTILTLTVLLALALVASHVGSQLSARLPYFECLQVLPDVEDTTASRIASGILFVLVLAQFWVHAQDRNVQNRPEKEDGVIGRYQRLLARTGPVPVARFHETDKSAIRAFMTKQAIFAAITLALLKAVSTRLPPVFPGDFKELLYVTAAGGFLVTLLTVFAAIQTYSTYVRVQWDDASGIALLIKGRRFDEQSFYGLTWSLLVALCAYQPWAALIAMPVFGLLMYKYYFFVP